MWTDEDDQQHEDEEQEWCKILLVIQIYHTYFRVQLESLLSMIQIVFKPLMWGYVYQMGKNSNFHFCYSIIVFDE